MGGCKATPPAQGIGKVHLVFRVLGKRARLSGETRSIPPARGSISPCRSCAEAKRSPGSPVLLLRVTWMSHVQPPRPLPRESIPLQHPSPGSPGERRFAHGCGCSKSFSPPFPAGWQHTSAVPASLWTAARPAAREGDLVPQHHFGVTHDIPRSCRSIQAPEPWASPELGSYQTAHRDTASSRIRAAHPCFIDWDRAMEG